MDGYDVFLSYARLDRERVLAVRDAMQARGLRVWLDETTIDTFESISGAIEQGVARSKALVAFYSEAYPTRRACQWELTAAFLAAARLGDPRRRVLVVNPGSSVEHIEPVHLRDALFARGSDELAVADAVVAHVAGLKGELGDRRVFVQPPWFGQRPVGSVRFVGRVVDMWRVHSGLHDGDVALITGARGDSLAQIMGMGGIGKSLLAEEYALRFAAAYPGGVFWLRASGHDNAGESLLPQDRLADRNSQLRGFARDLGLKPSELAPDEIPGALARALDGRAQVFLWIVDDLPTDSARTELEGWLAPGRHGKTLLTTRSRNYGAVANQIDLGVLSEVEGVELLSRHRQPDGPGELRAARGLVSDLGGHALALDVAGAALKAEQGVRSFAQYRAALASPSADELEFATRYAGELPNGHEPSIVTTLTRSIALIDEAGLDFLRLASVLAVHPIPASLVVDVFAEADGLDGAAARRRAVAAMHDAVALSLAETISEGDGLRQVHTLVSRTIRMLEQRRERSRALATAAIATLIVQLSESWSRRIAVAGAMFAHARHVASPLNSNSQATLLFWVAAHDWHRGDYRSALALLELVWEAKRELLGYEHPETLKLVNDIATMRYEMGDLRVARALQERVVEVQQRVSGDEHPDTLISMSNLANTLRASGHLEGSRALQEQVLEVRRRVLGDEHPETLISMCSLGETLANLGHLEGSRALQERVLAVRRRVLGDEHPDTLNSMHNLAATLYRLGELDDARALQERVLAVRQRVLSDEHPDTLKSMSNLAMTLTVLGDLRGAHALIEGVWEGRRRVLGDEHPDTLTAKSNLEMARRALDKL